MSDFKESTQAHSAAVVRYYHGSFRIIEQGFFVYCVETGKKIPLTQLKYWSVQHQEPYLGPQEAMKRFLFHNKKDS